MSLNSLPSCGHFEIHAILPASSCPGSHGPPPCWTSVFLTRARACPPTAQSIFFRRSLGAAPGSEVRGCRNAQGRLPGCAQRGWSPGWGEGDSSGPWVAPGLQEPFVRFTRAIHPNTEETFVVLEHEKIPRSGPAWPRAHVSPLLLSAVPAAVRSPASLACGLVGGRDDDLLAKDLQLGLPGRAPAGLWRGISAPVLHAL